MRQPSKRRNQPIAERSRRRALPTPGADSNARPIPDPRDQQRPPHQSSPRRKWSISKHGALRVGCLCPRGSLWDIMTRPAVVEPSAHPPPSPPTHAAAVKRHRYHNVSCKLLPDHVATDAQQVHSIFRLFRSHLGGRHHALLCQPGKRSPIHHRSHCQRPE